MIYILLQVTPAVYVEAIVFERTDALTRGGQALRIGNACSTGLSDASNDYPL